MSGQASPVDWFAKNAPAQAATAQPSEQSGVDWFASNAPKQPPAANQEPGVLSKVWNWVANTPIMDNVLPKGVTTKDIVRGAAFQKLFGEQYIPGVNDFDTKAELHLGDSPTKAALKTFLAGTAKDTADVGTSMTTPVGLGTMALGPAGKLPGAVGKVAKVALPLVSAGFAGQGVSNIVQAGTENTPEAWQQRLQGGAMVAGGAAGVAQGVKSIPRVRAPLGDTITTPRGTIPPENYTPADLKAYADANGIPLNAAQATEHNLPRTLQSAGERAAIGGSAVRLQAKASQAAIAEHAQNMADSFSPNTPDLASKGSAIQENVQKALDGERAKSRQAYAAIDQRAGNVTVDLTPVKQTAQKVLGDSQFVRSVGLDPKTATEILQDVKAMPNNATFSEAQDLRSALLDASRSPDLAIANRAQGWIKQLTGATDTAMMDAAQSAPGLESAFRDANKNWKQLQEDFNNPGSVLDRILSETDPNKIPQKLTQRGQIGGSPYNAQLLDKYGIDKGPVKAAIVEDLLGKDFRLWNKNLGGYSHDFLRSLFSPQELDGIYKTGAIARSVGMNTNPSGTAAVTSAIEQTMNPLRAAGQAVAAKAAKSPSVNNWLMTPRGGQSAARSRISAALAASGAVGGAAKPSASKQLMDLFH